MARTNLLEDSAHAMAQCARCDNPAMKESQLCEACSVAADAIDAPTADCSPPADDELIEKTVKVDPPADTVTDLDLQPDTLVRNEQQTPDLSDATVQSPLDDAAAPEEDQPENRFTLNEVLGEGAQGQVCLAFDNRLQRQVAIKFPRRDGGEMGADARTILSEARKAARLNHPNVVTVYDCGFWQGRPFISMEYVDGPSLSYLVKETGRVSVSRYIDYSRQILKALEAAHTNGLVHRDLKPHNVLTARDGTLKLTDFGIAHVPSDKTRTGPVAVAGTPAYMAPEQWSGERTDARSDLYAFGCLSHQLLTGSPPFIDGDIAEHHITTPPPLLTDRVPDIPEGIQAVISRCLEKTPTRRFQSASEVRTALKIAAKAARIGAETSSEERDGSGSTGFIRIAIGTVFVVVLGTAAWFLAAPEQGRAFWNHYILGDSAAKPPEKPAVGVFDEERRASGLEFLERAQEAENPKERLELAREARAHLDGEDRAVAEALITRTQTEINRVREADAVANFQGILGKGRQHLDAGRHREALASFDRAEKLCLTFPFLSRRAAELAEYRLPAVIALAKGCSTSGDFGEASDRYEQAGKIADEMGREMQRKRYRRNAELAGRLELIQMMVATQPRFALLEIGNLENQRTFPSAQLIRAEAYMTLGNDRAARETLEKYLESNPPPTLLERARKMLKIAK